MNIYRCKECGKSFKAYKKHDGQDRKFCSTTCSFKYRTGKKNPKVWKGIWKNCPICNKSFYVYHSEIEKKKTCSRKCKNEYEHVLGIHQGENCNFWKGGFDNYKGKNWYVQRKKARERDNNQCQKCGKTIDEHDTEMIVHHIVPYRFFHNDYNVANSLNNLVTLCHNCHAKEESHHWLCVPKEYEYLIENVVPQERVKRTIGTNRYSKSEIDFIFENKGKMEYVEIGKIINRTPLSIASKVYELNKKKKQAIPSEVQSEMMETCRD